MNKRYCIDVKEVPYETKKKESPKSNDSFSLVLFLAIVIGVFISPDLIDIKEYTPKDKQDTTYQLKLDDKVLKNYESSNSL